MIPATATKDISLSLILNPHNLANRLDRRTAV